MLSRIEQRRPSSPLNLRRHISAPIFARMDRSADVPNFQHILEFQALKSGLDLISTPIFLMQTDGAVIHANPASHAMLDSGQILALEGERLRTKRKLENDALDNMVAEVSEAPTLNRTPCIVGLRDRAGHVVMVISARHLMLLNGDGYVCVQVADLNQRPNASGTLLREIFSLTPTESVVAKMLIDGQPTDEIAAELAVSPETVRTHIKGILRKLNVRSQAQMICHAMQALVAVGGFGRI